MRPWATSWYKKSLAIPSRSRLERVLSEQVALAQMTRPRLKLENLNALVQDVLHPALRKQLGKPTETPGALRAAAHDEQGASAQSQHPGSR